MHTAWMHGLLASTPTLQEQDFVVGGDVQQLAQILLGLGRDAHELLAAMAHLHDAHTGALVVDDVRLRLLQDLQSTCCVSRSLPRNRAGDGQKKFTLHRRCSIRASTAGSNTVPHLQRQRRRAGREVVNPMLESGASYRMLS
eukprot:33630-Pelagomonas_calceolata.AAC.3